MYPRNLDKLQSYKSLEMALLDFKYPILKFLKLKRVSLK